MARTVVENTSGQDGRYFGWIPPHGETLDDGEQVTLEGDLRTVLAGGGNRYSRKTELAALDADVADGSVSVHEISDPTSSSAVP